MTIQTSTPQATTASRTTTIVSLSALAVLVLAAVAFPGWRSPFAFIVGLIGLIVIHEAGHFLAARLCGMQATEFFVGFGPRLWSKRFGETEFGFKAIPAGGYVKITGMTSLEEVDPSLEPRTYRSSSTSKRLLVISAGVLMNLLVAIVMFSAAFIGYRQIPAGVGLEVSQVMEGTPAAGAIKVGDRIESIDGLNISSWDDVKSAIADSGGETIVLTVARDGTTTDVEVTPLLEDGRGYLGVSPAVLVEDVSPSNAPLLAIQHTGDIVTGTAGSIAKMLSPAWLAGFTDAVTAGEANNLEERPVSVIGIIDIASENTSDLWSYLEILGFISVALAVFNALPLLPLDGGHAVVAVYERVASTVRRRRVMVNYEKLVPVSMVVIFLLVWLSFTAAIADVQKIVTG